MGVVSSNAVLTIVWFLFSFWLLDQIWRRFELPYKITDNELQLGRGRFSQRMLLAEIVDCHKMTWKDFIRLTFVDLWINSLLGPFVIIEYRRGLMTRWAVASPLKAQAFIDEIRKKKQAMRGESVVTTSLKTDNLQASS